MSILNSVTPATSGQAIDLSSTDWDYSGGKTPMRGLLVGTPGNVVGQLAHDVADVTYPVPAGSQPLRFKIIRKTGTTATGLVALF